MVVQTNRMHWFKRPALELELKPKAALPILLINTVFLNEKFKDFLLLITSMRSL